MLQKTAILTFTFLLACAYAQNETYYDDPYYQSEPETHIVKRGETLYAISKRYGMTVNEIMRANQLRSSTIKIGQRLEVESTGSKQNNQRVASRSQDDSRGIDGGELKVNGPRTYYKVQRGDNIYSIASQFGVLVDEIREWNGLSSISVGQTLIVGQNDIARIPSYRPAPQDDVREDESIYRRLNTRTSSRSLSQDRTERNTRRFDREEERPSISSYRQRAQEEEPRERYEDRDYDRYNDRYQDNDRYDSRYDDREADNYRINSSDRYRREQESRNINNSDRYSNDEQVDDRRFFSSDNARRTQSSYDDYREDNSNSRIRAADINAGSRSGLLYNYVGDGLGEPQKTTPDRYESRINARTVKPQVDAINSRMVNPSSLTGDFTELKSKKATNNRFYAFHNSLPIGSKVKMKIPKNEGYVEVEIIDRLPSYERVMIGLSPACTAILEGAGNPHTVTITAN